MKQLEWFGTISSVVGSFVVAAKVMILGYTLFLAGSMAWLIVGAVTKNRPLIVLNGFFFAANVFGFINNL